MGLDMYLDRVPRFKTKEELEAESDEAWKIGYEYWREHIRKPREVAYWRKVNFLHGYIVRTFAGGVDECQEIELKRRDIELILSKVREVADVLAGKRLIPQKRVGAKGFRGIYADDPDKEPYTIQAANGRLTFPKALDDKLCEGYFKVEASAKEQLDRLLPPRHGSFFGSYEYDNFYVWDVFDTVVKLNKVLDEWDDGFRYIYQASW